MWLLSGKRAASHLLGHMSGRGRGGGRGGGGGGGRGAFFKAKYGGGGGGRGGGVKRGAEGALPYNQTTVMLQSRCPQRVCLHILSKRHVCPCEGRPRTRMLCGSLAQQAEHACGPTRSLVTGSFRSTFANTMFHRARSKCSATKLFDARHPALAGKQSLLRCISLGP